MVHKKVLVLAFFLFSVLLLFSQGCFLFNTSPDDDNYDYNNNRESVVKSIKLPDGGNYTGELKDGKPHGEGTVSYDGGGSYTGGFLNGEKNGEGHMIYADGSEYTGSFRSGMKHGEGIYAFSDGRRYEGGFKNDLFDGKGELIWSEDIKYVGQWKDGQIYGENTYNWPLKNFILTESGLEESPENGGFYIGGEPHTPYY